MEKKQLFIFCAFVGSVFFNVPVYSAEYYISAINGNDVNPGTKEKPWRTIGHAQTLVSGGDTIYLSSGQHGMYSETVPTNRSGLVTYRGLPGEVPLLSGININYQSASKADLLFKGITINSGSLVNSINLGNAESVEISECTINAAKWSLNTTNIVTGVNIYNSKKISVKNTLLNGIGLGAKIAASDDISINNNFIRVKGGSGVQHLGGNTNILIANNHILGEEFTPYPEDPLAMKDVHQSIISIRGDNIIIRNNIMHNMANGIMTYIPDAAGGENSYDNIIIENNAIYNIDSGFSARFYNSGNNIIVKNNIFFSGIREGACADGVTGDARYRYQTALAVHSLAQGNNGSGLHLYNNIFAGATYIPKTTVESNNIFWSLADYDTISWQKVSTSNTSKVLVDSYLGCGAEPKIFENNSLIKISVIDLLKNKTGVDILLADKSVAKNFGNQLLQSETTLGSIGTNGFIANNNVIRSDLIHSSGPYESYFNLKSPEGFQKLK